MHSDDKALRILWGVETSPARGPRARWSIAEVAEAAIAIADDGGLASVSLAAVASRLGLTTTALYRYVDAKQTLVALMVDEAIGDPPTLEDGPWMARCGTWAHALAARYSAHPWLVDVPQVGMPRQPRSFAWLDAIVVAASDLHAIDGMRLAVLLESVVRSFAVMTTSPAEAEHGWMRLAVADRHPALAEAIERDWADPAAELELAIEIVLHGAAALDR